MNGGYNSSVQNDIHLSVVATSRNDNHGGHLTQRMQHFVDGFVAQCKRHNLRAELIMVEWNPPADRRPLAEELAWPADSGPCEIRIVTVPREMHAKLAYADKLPLFQMIAKNVGIRRARGKFVLATNIDILFSDEVIRQMRDGLQPGRLYRVDRADVPTHVPVGGVFDGVLEFCRTEEFRLNANGATLIKRNGRWDPRSPFFGMVQQTKQLAGRFASGWFKRKFGKAEVAPGGAAGAAARPQPKYYARAFRLLVRFIKRTLLWIWHVHIRKELHTNACGDFTLLSREDWFALRGYAEWELYSWNIDSLLLYQAHRSGLREVYMGPHARIYHIEHAPGSGFTPESSEKLFARLASNGIPCLDWEKDMEPLIAKMDADRRRGVSPIVYCDENWGWADRELPETRVATAARWDDQPFDTLRRKWVEIPVSRRGRLRSTELAKLPAAELMELWRTSRTDITTGPQFAHRGWYHALYREFMRGKKVLDVGSGIGIDSITFAEAGAEVTFLDIAASNLELIRRVCGELGLSKVRFVHLESLASLEQLEPQYDVIMAMGSLHHAPQSVIKPEVDILLRRLKTGGRWLQLAYPQTRWVREGSKPFDRWGENTDGENTPWVEWYDLPKLLALLAPATFEVVLCQEFHNSDFIWFDLLKTS